MKPGTGTITLVATFLVVFGVELASHSAGNEASLLKLGALPDSGELHGQYWRLGTYSFLHFNSTHLLVNAAMLLWIGRIVENRVNFADATAIYVSSVLCSAAMILLVHYLHPKAGATMGASGGVFGLLAAALLISYRQKAQAVDRQSRFRTLLWVALFIGMGISVFPGISMAGHVGGLIGGAVVAPVVRLRTNV
jgi:membrane associated rhomboid family serine protease